MSEKINSFRDLIVWQKSADLVEIVYKTTENFPKSELYGLVSQMRRSAISVSSNIAEGFKRNYKKEKVQFYHTAYGSLSELESQIEISKRLYFVKEEECQRLLALATEISKMIAALIKSTHRKNPKSYILYSIFFFTTFYFLFSASAQAEVLRGSSFQILDPVITVSGERATSTSFTLLSAFAQLGLGTSSATSFQLNPGFLSFPVVTVPTVTATAGDGKADLSWTSSSGFVGWTVSGYSVGQSTTSGGPYSYTSVGNVTSSTRTGLDNGTVYHFIVNPEDTFGNRIATSTEVSATPAASPTPPPAPPSGGTGGGGPPGFVQTGTSVAVFRGLAYPESAVTLLQGTFRRSAVTADVLGNFEIVASGVTAGVHTFGITARDSRGRNSRLLSISVDVPQDETIAVPDIFVPPTIALDKRAVRAGDPLVIEGFSAPAAEVTVFVSFGRDDGSTSASLSTTADAVGAWSISIDTADLSLGDYTLRASAEAGGLFSLLSTPVSIIVGDETIRIAPTVRPEKGDVNGDGRVNLVDFSIAAFYFEKPLFEWPARFRQIEREQLNGDGIVNLTDFSLMAFYWTG